MRKKPFFFVPLILAAAITLSGCADKSSTEKKSFSPQAMELAEEYFAQDADSYEAWKDIPRDKVIAYVEGAEDSDFFNIMFGEFFSEYMYYLLSYRIDDDMSDNNKESCANYRDNIITFMTFERQYLYVGKKEYGISEETLTEEQKNEIKTASDNVMKDWASNFYTSVSAKLGPDASEEEISAMCSEVLMAVLNKCGLQEDTFYRWELNRYIQELIIAEIVKKASVTDDDVLEMLDKLIIEAKDKAENDPQGYMALPSYASVYIPEGTRMAAHILLDFDPEKVNAVYEAKNSGDTVKMNALINEAYTGELRRKADEIAGRLAAGENFEKLRGEYDSDESGTYLVLKNSVIQPAAYTEALYSLGSPGDTSGAVVTEDGVYFIQYTRDASVSDEGIESIKSYLRSNLESSAATNAQNKEYSRWLTTYPYTVDYETLRIDRENSILSGIDTTLYQ